jgi:hypothetical protein
MVVGLFGVPRWSTAVTDMARVVQLATIAPDLTEEVEPKLTRVQQKELNHGQRAARPAGEAHQHERRRARSERTGAVHAVNASGAVHTQ